RTAHIQAGGRKHARGVGGPHARVLSLEAELDEGAAALVRGVVRNRKRVCGAALRLEFVQRIAKNRSHEVIRRKLLVIEEVAMSQIESGAHLVRQPRRWRPAP